jgi:anti-anti-sigma factor
MARPNRLTIELIDGRVMLSGELDMGSGPQMCASVLALAGGQRLELDLREVSFMDCRGLRWLLEVQQRVPSMRIVAMGPRVERVLALTDMCDVLVGAAERVGANA